MKRFISLIIFVFIISLLYCQTDSIKEIIFVPHPRSNDKQVQSVLKSIELIDFSRYSMKILGGDLTYYTTIDREAMDYCDRIFDLDNPNTLWSVGNHDLNNKSLISEYTNRPTYYAYTKDNITFMVLDTEINSDRFISSYFTGDQLDFIKSITDTISKSDYLFLVQHRLLWMIGNIQLEEKLDSVGASTRELDTANFYEEVYPLLQNVKKQGIRIICLGGDRADINIEYSPEDSITYLAATMVPEFSDEKNNIIILHHNIDSSEITWSYVSLSEVDKVDIDTTNINSSSNDLLNNFTIYPNPSKGILNINFKNNFNNNICIEIIDITGICIFKDQINKKFYYKELKINKKGFYIIKLTYNNKSKAYKVIVR